MDVPLGSPHAQVKHRAIGGKVRNVTAPICLLNHFFLFISGHISADLANLFVNIRWECSEPVPAVQGDINVKYVGLWKSWLVEMERMQTLQVLSRDTLQTGVHQRLPVTQQTKHCPDRRLQAPSGVR